MPTNNIQIEWDAAKPSAAPSPIQAEWDKAAPTTPPAKKIGDYIPSVKDVKEYYQFLHTPTEPAKGETFKAKAYDYLTRVVSESVSKTAVGTAEFPYQLAKMVTDPLIKSSMKSPQDLHKDPVALEKEIARPAKQILQVLDSLGHFTGEPLGLYGWQKLKERWGTDPAGSVLGIAPLLGAITNLAFEKKITLKPEVEKEIIKEQQATPPEMPTTQPTMPLESTKEAAPISEPRQLESEWDKATPEAPLGAKVATATGDRGIIEQYSKHPDTIIEDTLDHYKNDIEAHKPGLKAKTAKVRELAEKQIAEDKEVLERIKKQVPEVKDKVDEILKEKVERTPEQLQKRLDKIKGYPNQTKRVKAEISELESKLRAGPGAMTSGAQWADFKDLTNKIKDATPKGASVTDRFNIGRVVASAKADFQDALSRPIELLKGTMAAIKGYHDELHIIKGPEDFKASLRELNLALTKSNLDIKSFAKESSKAGFTPKLGEAIYNYLEADGDKKTLEEWASKAPKDLKEGYVKAMNLTPSEIEAAKNFRNFIDLQFQDAAKEGFLEDALDNYVHRVWKNPADGEKAWAEVNYGLLKNDASFMKKRVFHSTVEGEMLGRRLRNKDIRFSVADWAYAYNRAKATRAFIADLGAGVAKDGRPLVAADGGGKLIPESGKIVTYPDVLPESMKDFKLINQPAMRQWKWITNDENGNPVLMKGHLKVNPEIYDHLNNMLKSSALRKSRVVRGILTTQSVFKQTLLGPFGVFHMKEMGVHAVFHGIDPLRLPEIDLNIPDQALLVKNSLTVADSYALTEFEEGVSGGGLWKYIPGVGKSAEAYNKWLFESMIPRVKMKMALKALERNRLRFPNKSPNEVAEISASQANAAFGEQNYRWIGRNPTTQDILRLAFLAPDFLEARFRFLLQGTTTALGREQAVALLRGAAIMYVPIRIINAVLNNGDPQWNPRYAFSIKVGNRIYTPRNILSDTLFLLTSPGSFIYHKLNPYTARAAIEALTGKDIMGRKVSVEGQLVDYVRNIMSIALQGAILPSTATSTWWESLLEATGTRSSTYYTESELKAHQYYLESLPTVSKSDKYRIKLLKAYKENAKPEEIDKLERDSNLPPNELNQIQREAQIPNLTRWMKHLNVDQAIEVWHVMTLDERMQLRGELSQKYRLINKLPLNKQDAARAKLDKALSEPDENPYLHRVEQKWLDKFR